MSWSTTPDGIHQLTVYALGPINATAERMDERRNFLLEVNEHFLFSNLSLDDHD